MTVSINGSPRGKKGNTDWVLTPFLRGMEDAGSEVEPYYASRLNVKPCACGEMYCWYTVPGECCFKDDMQQLYARLREADTLVLATPVYIPLPGEMQNIINRLCPLVKPILEMRDGRTRARFHKEVRVARIVLVSTGGWWEMGNFGTVVRIAEELAADVSVEFAGAVLRPHAFLMWDEGELTKDGQVIVQALRRAGHELVAEGAIHPETLDTISQPLISELELRDRYNRLV